MRRALVDLKAPPGRGAFLRLADAADVVLESFRPGVVDRLGIGYEAVSGRNPRIVYCSTTGYGQTGPRAAVGGPRPQLPRRRRLPRLLGPRRRRWRPPIPGATVADSAGGGMHAVIAILAALVGGPRTGEGAYLDVSVADGVLADAWRCRSTSTWPPANDPGPGTACSPAATPATTPTHPRRQVARGRGHRAALLDQPLPGARARAVERRTRPTTRCRTRSGPTCAPPSPPATATSGIAAAGRADTCVAPVLSVPEVVDDPQVAARGVVVEGQPDHAAFRQVGPVLAGMPAAGGPYALPDADRHRHRRPAGRGGLSADEIAALRRRA